MNEPADRPAWREELDAIVGARAHGQSEEIFPRLQQLDRRHPNIPEINYQLAWTCEVLGRNQEALPFYEKAVALGLPVNELSGALIGLGSVLRELGEPDRSAEVLGSGKAQFPGNREFDVFLALTRHAQGRHAEAMRLALETLCDTTEDPGLTAYQRTIRHAASRL